MVMVSVTKKPKLLGGRGFWVLVIVSMVPNSPLPPHLYND